MMAYTIGTVTASGLTFAQMQAGGFVGQLNGLVATNVATLPPQSAHTWSATGGGSTGGALAAGTYYSVVTEIGNAGETNAGPVSSQITVASTNQPQITFQALQTGNVSRNVYLGLPSGTTSGPFYLYASGITASTYTLAVAAPTSSYAGQPPKVNTTGLSYADSNGNTINTVADQIRSIAQASGSSFLTNDLVYLLSQFNSGQPVTFDAVISKLRKYHYSLAVMVKACQEIGTLIDANPGTINPSTTGIGGSYTKRTWP